MLGRISRANIQNRFVRSLSRVQITEYQLALSLDTPSTTEDAINKGFALLSMNQRALLLEANYCFVLAKQFLESSKNSVTKLPHEKLSNYIDKGNKILAEFCKYEEYYQKKYYQADIYLDYINIHHSIQDLVICGIESYKNIRSTDACRAFSKAIEESSVNSDFDKLMKSIAYLYTAKCSFGGSTRMTWEGTINLEMSSNIFEEINDTEVTKSEDYLQHKRELTYECRRIKICYGGLSAYKKGLEKHIISLHGPGFFEQIRKHAFPDSNDTKISPSNIHKKQ